MDKREAVSAELGAAVKRGYIAAYRILRNRAQAHDACQEAAARALAAHDRYDTARPFYPWFYRILKNDCIDRIKRRQRTVTFASPPTAPDETRSAENEVLHFERGSAVARAIEALPQDMREVIELRHFQDLSYEEMSEVLGCPIGTVMSRLYRARKRLRTTLLQDPGFRGHASKEGVEP
jgi:RNA polymerase sigma-70 factor (ECF subfamily)